MWAAVQDIMNRKGAPEVGLVPRFTTDNLGVEWVLRTGTIALTRMAESFPSFDYRVRYRPMTFKPVRTSVAKSNQIESRLK